MNFSKSPLRLNYYLFPSVRVEADHSYAGEPAPDFDQPAVEDLLLSVHTRKHGDAWALSLTVRCDPRGLIGGIPAAPAKPQSKVRKKSAGKVFGYAFEITAVGEMAAESGFAESGFAESRQDHDSIIQINGLSVLYSSMREFLGAITSKGPYPPVMLPTMTFIPEPAEPDPALSKATFHQIRKAPGKIQVTGR